MMPIPPATMISGAQIHWQWALIPVCAAVSGLSLSPHTPRRHRWIDFWLLLWILAGWFGQMVTDLRMTTGVLSPASECGALFGTMSAESTLQDLISETRSAISLECINIAACTLWVCDYLHSLDAEVKFVWRRRWTVGKTLFVLLQYGTATSLIISVHTGVDDRDARSATALTAFEWEVAENIGALVLPFLELGIFMLGIHALLGATRRWQLLLIVVYLTSAAISTTLMVNHLIARARGKNDVNMFRIIGNYWVFIRHLLIFSLATYALYRRYHNHLRDLEPSGRTSLISTLRRDGMMYFLGISASTLWACIFYTPGFPKHIREVAYSGSLNRAVGTMLATRLFINLGRNVEAGGTVSEIENSSTIQFASHRSDGEPNDRAGDAF